MFDRASLRCENFPVTIAGETVYSNHEKITSVDLLEKLQRFLNSYIDQIRNEGCPLQKVADLLVLQDIMLEKDLDRADDMIVYLLARPGCNFDFGLYGRLKEIAMSVVRNELTGDQLFSLWYSVAFHRWSEEKQDFQHIDNFKADDKSENSAEETHKESESAS
jgi:hypothetical protein